MQIWKVLPYPRFRFRWATSSNSRYSYFRDKVGKETDKCKAILNCLTEHGPIPMLDKISWLHLSDFHFRAGVDNFSQEVSFGALARDIPSRLSVEFPLQFIAVTGDIAFSGQPSEYELALGFFSSLLGDLGLDAERLCIVPGNHDVDRGRQSFLYKGVWSSLTSQRDIDEFLGQDNERVQLMDRQLAFREFRDLLMEDGHLSETHEGLARVRHFDLNGFRVCFLELNSAWLSGEKDRLRSLLVGERQVIGALTLAESNKPHLTVALVHHPMDWLAEFDRIACSNRIVPQVDFVHSGHLHAPQASIMLTPGSQCLHSVAGSSHETRHYRNSYNLLEYDIGNATCRTRQFEYQADSGQFQEFQKIKYRLPLRGEIQATSAEIADLLRERVPTSEPYASYMACLLKGSLEEVPTLLDAETPIIASKNLPVEYQIPVVGHFLRIANLLKAFDAVPLHEMLSSQETAISEFTNFLNKTASTHSEFANLLADRELQARKLSGISSNETSPHQEQYLDELVSGGQLDELIDTATRYCKSSDEVVQVAARRRLAWALLQQNDKEMRKKGSDQAFQNLDEKWADSRDFLLASAAAESLDDHSLSESTALSALGIWPNDPGVRAYCRSLATQRGSQTLRKRLNETGGTG